LGGGAQIIHSGVVTTVTLAIQVAAQIGWILARQEQTDAIHDALLSLRRSVTPDRRLFAVRKVLAGFGEQDRTTSSAG